MQFRKYEFTSTSLWNSLKNTIPLDSNGFLTTCTIAELGFLPTVHATYDLQGNLLTTATFSNKYSVDILWHDGTTIPSGFTQYEVWPQECGTHTFLGLEHLYREEYNKRNN